MSLTQGTRVGPYEIAAQIGKGGMGEVYRARDTRLQRDVAIKVLPDQLTHDSERLARFEREAQLLASVNHPHIAQIYGLEQSGSATCIVMELVEGETLDDRITRQPGGAMSLDQVRPLALQIVDALAAAHDRGVVHRDLKPANIQITPAGDVKLLDFGLAKMSAGSTGSMSADPSLSPTITSPAMTAIGVLMGTAAYMSPEQAKGRVADKRSDIWAFGCVLFEMLTGARTFAGDDVSDTLAAVLRGEPQWSLLPSSTPEPIRKLLRRCLEKDHRKRLADIADARFELEDAGPAPTTDIASSRRPLWRRAVPALAAATAAAAIVGMVAWMMWPPAPAARVLRFAVPAPVSLLNYSALRSIGISPDGARIAFAAEGRLYVRSLSESDPKPIPGSEGPAGGYTGAPVFSADGESLVYWEGTGGNGTLKRIPVTGGTAVTLARGTFPLGTTWDVNGIVFGQFVTGQTSRILRIRPEGGAAETLISVGDGEVASGPQILPDGETVLYTLVRDIGTIPDLVQERWDRAQIVVQRIGSKERKTVVDGGSDARYLPTGQLIYFVGSTLFSVPFDVTRMERSGPPVQVLTGVARTTFGTSALGGTHLSVSDTGTLVYLLGASASAPNRLALLERASDRTTTLNVPPDRYVFPRLSPDGKSVAVAISTGERGSNIWVYDLAGNTSIRQLTFEGRNSYPVWSSDSTRIAFQSDREGDSGIFWQRADGATSAERLTKAEQGTVHVPAAWSPDGKTLLLTVLSLAGKQGPTRTLSMLRNGKVEPFGVATNPIFALSPVFSPDGQWVAYTATSAPENGDPIAWVQSFPPPSQKYRVVEGIQALWSREGEILAVQPGGLFGVRISTTPSFRSGSPQLVRRPPFLIQPNEERGYDMTSDGRILGVVETPSNAREQPPQAASQIQIIVNWFNELKPPAPAK